MPPEHRGLSPIPRNRGSLTYRCMRSFPYALCITAFTLAALNIPPATAGPPYQTDDPDPTDTGGLEAYAIIEGDWDNGFAGSIGVEANYGAASDFQLSLGLPLDVASRPFHVSR